MQESLVDWFREKQNYFFYGFLFLAVVIFGYFKFSPRKENTNFLSVEKAYHHWEKTGENLDELETVLNHHPELETKFGALIAERFLLQGDGLAAKPFAEAVFRRISRHIPEHVEFAEGSVLIAQGKISEVLQQSLALKERLSKDLFLYGCTLVRIAGLSQELHNKDQEFAILQELEDFLTSKTTAAIQLMNCFSHEKTTFQDYIAFRKNSLL